ncbi:MAG: SH3 domain-containing protein, partial [Oscillospiraceae bacterium]|nr:SH3 domain-containing protein [Oscillospiraceae bacterium]
PLPAPQPAARSTQGKGTTLLAAAVAVMAVLVLVMGFLVLEQQLSFIGLFGERRSAVTQENGDEETTIPAEETQPNDTAVQQRLGLPATPAMFYTTANLHLRAAPSTQAASIVILGEGIRVNVVFYYSETWFRVQRGNDVGYMAAEFLRH